MDTTATPTQLNTLLSPLRLDLSLWRRKRSARTPLVGTSRSAATQADSGRGSRSGPLLRDRYTFLSDPSCPLPLQALATLLITRYHETATLHGQLFTASTLEACAHTAQKLIEAWLDHAAIRAELDYYQAHRKPLGHHRYFTGATEATSP